MVLDFQEMTAGDLPVLMEVTRAVADSARKNGWPAVWFALPPGDTAAYPTDILARAADMMLVRLYGEHRPGTAPGPLASPEWVDRQLGMRISAVGPARIVAELAVFGYMWQRDGTARPVSFREAQLAAAAESVPFRRDEASGYLTASSARAGWQIWVSDSQTIERLVGTVRRRGVSRFSLAGIADADPDILPALAPLRR